MGQQVSSRNYLDNLTETVTRIIQENVQACKVNSTQIQELAFTGGCENITIKNVDFNQLSGVDFNCMQDAQLNAKVASQMHVELEQLAKSLISGLNFNIASTVEAQNFITNHVRLVTEIMNKLTQECTVNAGQYQGIKCGGGEGQAKNILVENVSFNQIIKSVFNCAQKGDTVADVTTQIEQFIKQTAISENKGLSFELLFVLVIVIIIVLAIVILNKALDWKFLAIGVPIIAIIIYLILASKRNWWPFKSKLDDKKRKPPAPIPPPPAPKIVQNLQSAQQQAIDLLRPEQYRRLKYEQLYGIKLPVFSRPYEAKQNCGTNVKPVRLAMKMPTPIIV